MSGRDDRLVDLAAALSDGAAIDWDAAESAAATESERLQIRGLRRVRGMADAQVASSSQADGSGRAYDSLMHPTGGTASSGAAPPVTWGALRAIEKIGRGQFGDVYRAHDPRLDRDVALKLLRRASDADSLGSAVIEEGRLLAKIRHPNVVTVYGAERIDGRVGVWMELVRGRTLEEELAARGPFPADEVIAIGVEVCRALAAVHRAGLVHRDVKAQNVMRDADGRLVLMDFGTGRELDTNMPLELAGTPLYMAPEVLAGQPATAAADLYSLGVVLHHLATGGFPVNGRTLKEIRDAHAHARGPTTLAAAVSKIPLRLRTAIDRALDPAPARRFARAEDMAAALALAGPTSGAPAAVRSARAGLIAAGVFLAVIGAASAGRSWWGGASAGGGSSTAALGSANERVIWSGPDAPSWGAISPDGRSVAFIEQDKGNVALHDLATGQVRVLTDGDWTIENGAEAEQPVFSRDGRYVAYTWFLTTADDQYLQIRTVDLTEVGLPTPRVVYEYREGWIGPSDFSPDGSRISVVMRVGAGTGRVGWVSIADKSMHIVARTDWRMSTTAAWSPDGAYIAYDAAPTEQLIEPDVYLASVDGARTIPARTGPGRDTVAGWSPQGELLYLSEGRGIRQVWSMPIRNGAPDGEPTLVEGDLRGVFLTPSHSGAFDLIVTNNDQAVHTAVVDFTTGQAKTPSSAAVSGAYPRNRQPKWSRDGEYFAYISSGQARQLSYRVLSIQRLDGDLPRILPLKLAQLWTYDLSPDNRTVLARAQDLQGGRGIFRIDAVTGEIAHLLAWTDEEAQFLPQWADDGESFYYTRARAQGQGAFVLRHLANGGEDVLFRYKDLKGPDGKPLPGNRDSVISPDRQYVVCYTVQPESVLWLIRVSDGFVRELYRVKRPNAFVHNALVWTSDSGGVIVNQQEGPPGSSNPYELWYAPLHGEPRKLDVHTGNIRPEAIAVHGEQVAFVAGDPPAYTIIRLEGALAALAEPAAARR